MADASRTFLRKARRDQHRLYHVHAAGWDPDGLGGMLENVLGSAHQRTVIGAMQWLIPSAEFVFTKGRADLRAVYGRSSDFAVAQPLESFGDGAVRLAGIVLAVLLSRNGTCLIDEVESGLHYSLFPDLWRLLDKLSRDLSVQVFATTHSRDCLDAFAEASAEKDFDAAFYRLERNPGGAVEAVRLDYEGYFRRVEGLPFEVR